MRNLADLVVHYHIFRKGEIFDQVRRAVERAGKWSFPDKATRTLREILYFLCECTLAGREPSVSDIYLETGVSKSTTIRSVTMLEHADVIAKTSSDKDGRRIHVDLTESYRRILDQLVQKSLSEFESAFGSGHPLPQDQHTSLIENSASYQDIFDEAAVPASVCGPDGHYLRVNHAFCEMLGYTRKELLRKTSLDVTHPADRARNRRLHREIRSMTRRQFEYEKRYVRKNGRVLWASLTYTIVRDGAGRFLYTIVQHQDITEQKQADAALSENEVRFKDFAEAASDRFWETDQSYRFTAVHVVRGTATKAEHLKLIGKTRWELVGADPDRDELWRAHRADVLAHRPFRNFIYPLPGPRGSVAYWSVSGRPIFGRDGTFQGYRGTAADVTKRMHAEQVLREARQRAEFANRIKTEFVANLSHEMRTPLNAILGFSHIIAEETMGSVGPRYAALARDIRDSAHHLLDLISDTLDLSQIELTGQLPLREAEVDVRELVQSCYRTIRGRAEEKGIGISTRIARGVPRLFADGRRVKQVLLNLLENAVKFTDKGGTIMLSASTKPGEGLQFRITDSGNGMPEDWLSVMTGRRPHAHPRAPEHNRTGLGLHLVKSLVELHGGTVGVKSPPGAGTTITVLFPKERTRRAP